MFLDDYGEKIKVEVCNLLWQKEDEFKFENLHEAWDAIKDLLDTKIIKIQVRRDVDKKRIHKLKIFKVPSSGEYVVSNTAWENTKNIKSTSDIYDTLADLVLSKESNV